MKLLCLILSLMVVLLSANPCCTDDICQGQSFSKNTVSCKVSAPEKECAGCSPFFSCGTCAGFVIAKPVVYPALFIIDNIIKGFSVYRKPYVHQVALTIWQPPQIS